MQKKEKFVLQWHITHRCNLRCKHCYQEDYTKDLELDTLINILNQFKKFVEENDYRGHINFTGGEPMVALDKLEVLMNICEKSGITFGILTNGTLLTQDIVDRLSKYKNLSFIQMSLEGTRKVNDKIRGKGSFKQVMKSVKMLQKAHIQTMISFTCHKENYKELKKLIWTCRIHKVDRFWTDRLVPIGNNTLELISTEDYRKVIKTLYKESLSKIGGLQVETNRALQGLDYENKCGYKCSAGRKLIALLADGTLLPCRRLPIEIGNLKSEKLDNLMIKCKQTMNKLEFSTENECSKCPFKKKCNNGTRCLTYAVTGNFNAKDINCWK